MSQCGNCGNSVGGHWEWCPVIAVKPKRIRGPSKISEALKERDTARAQVTLLMNELAEARGTIRAARRAVAELQTLFLSDVKP